MLWIL